jgi:hypothetical protein
LGEHLRERVPESLDIQGFLEEAMGFNEGPVIRKVVSGKEDEGEGGEALKCGRFQGEPVHGFHYDVGQEEIRGRVEQSQSLFARGCGLERVLGEFLCEQGNQRLGKCSIVVYKKNFHSGERRGCGALSFSGRS